MTEVEFLSLLIGDIYDAALDLSAWSAVLEKFCGYVGATAAMIFWQDSTLKIAQRYYSWGDEPHFTKLYFEKYVGLSPFITLPHFVDVGEVKSVRELIPWSEIQDTKFYKEWMLPQDYVDNVFVTLDKSKTSYASIAVTRTQRHSPAHEEVCRRMQLVTPHVRRAVLIGKMIDLHKFDAASLLAAMDGLAAAIFLVDAASRIVNVNAAGRSMLDEGMVMTSEHGVLIAVDAQAQASLREVVDASLRGDEQVGTKGVAVGLTAKDNERYLAHILPLTSGARQKADFRRSATAAIFVSKAALNIPSPPEVLARLYKLTPSELRVLHAVVEVGGVPSIAEALGISEATVKVHLHHVFQKTGARRQADLVKIVAGAKSPLAG